MSDESAARDHEARWRSLRQLGDAYSKVLPSDLDWEIVLRFYAGLHLLHA